MSYGEINESLLTKKRFEMAEKALPLTRKKKKNTDKKKQNMKTKSTTSGR